MVKITNKNILLLKQNKIKPEFIVPKMTNLHVDLKISLLFLGGGLKQTLHGLQKVEDVETATVVPKYQETSSTRIGFVVPVGHT